MEQPKIKLDEDMPVLTVEAEVGTDIENINDSVYHPLEGFLNQQDYQSVLLEKRLSNDKPWTIPIILDVNEEDLQGAKEGDQIILSEPITKLRALLQIEEVFPYDKKEHSRRVYGTEDVKHPGVAKTFSMKNLLVGGKVKLTTPGENRFQQYSLTPRETTFLFKEKGWKTVVGFQTRNVPHMGHEYLQKTALTFTDGIFINPVIGPKKEGDFKDDVILESYKALIKNYYLKERAVMAILRSEMRYAGPREAIFHALVRKNFGCTHFIVGRDHAGVGKFYPPYAAQEIFDEFPDLGIVPLFFTSFFYCRKCSGVANEKTCPHPTSEHIDFSGTKLRDYVTRGEPPPPELIRPEVSEIIMSFKDPFVD
jgi:sulfate adenylyltransferase